ncbi:hypothetical protein H5410_040841 [Solanum commersonii]|uniref:Uncharacterized protein n=1 Tax=Solanum commersonii TaxID=4109 RepID=A0A9J5XRZ9_SOLCO|nr:hypothetical protein H5410_040841 [Solanum commersonii]
MAQLQLTDDMIGRCGRHELGRNDGRIRPSHWVRGQGARVISGFKGLSRLRVGSWNIGTLRVNSIELVKMLKKMKISILVSRRPNGDHSGFDNVYGGFGLKVRNRGASLLDFAKVFELKEKHLVTFPSSVAQTQIDYLLLRKDDRGLCKDCKVIPSENHTTQHKLLAMDLENKREEGEKEDVI